MRRLTNNNDRGFGPDWSPDGKKIVFIHEPIFDSPLGGDEGIFTIDADGSNLTMLIADKHAEWPTWSPDGTQIAFLSHGDKSLDVWRIDADGSNKVNITKTETQEAYPSWGR